MAVAVKSGTQMVSRPMNRLALGSLVGTLYVFAGLAAVFYVLPEIWSALGISLGAAVGKTIEILLMLALAGCLGMLGLRLVGNDPPVGLRSGIFTGFVGVLLVLFITRGIGGILQNAFGDASMAGAISTVVVGLGLLAGFASLFFRSGFDNALIAIEEQGWFRLTPYKRSQGQRVRRGTMLGILVLAGCGVYTMLSHGTLRTAATDWGIVLPFTGGRTLVLLPSVQFSLPILITGISFWLAYRIVHFPAFADFLIATEAELNKVSWTTRKRLIQDTVVVLVTMVIITVLLLGADVVWNWSLRQVGVIQSVDDTAAKKAANQDW